MKVASWMTSPVEPCAPADALSRAALVMAQQNCGFVPVVRTNDHKLVGVITDRDICLAVAVRHESPDTVRVQEVMSTHLRVTRRNESLNDALQTMRDHRVHRLPVVDALGHVEGVLSLTDIVRAATGHPLETRDGVPYGDVVEALKVIGHPHGADAVPEPAAVDPIEPLSPLAAEITGNT